MYRTMIALVAVAALALPSVASADFKTGNSWMQTPKGAADAMVNGGYVFFGGELPAGNHKVTYVRCKGDLSMTRTAAGSYHHMRCGATLRGTSYVALFDFWQVGDGKKNFRVTNLAYVAS